MTNLRLLFLLILIAMASAAYGQFTLFDFEGPALPNSSLVDGGDGFFYGTTVNGGAGKGSVYRIDLATGELTTVVTFTGPNGANPYGDLLVSGQSFYGTTMNGGANDLGTVYRIDRATLQLTTLKSFDETNDHPGAGLTAFGSLLYGTTTTGSSSSTTLGGIFTVDPATGAVAIVANFTDCANPMAAPLVVGQFLYGTTQHQFSGSGPGAVYKFDPATKSVKTIAKFTNDDGYASSGLVAQGALLYGTTSLGFGIPGDGRIFTVDPASDTVTKIYTFASTASGVSPSGNLAAIGASLYGTTTFGGATAVGALYRLDPGTNQVTTLASFDRTSGAAPLAGLTSFNGVLYGASSEGGPNDGGVVFRFDPSSQSLTSIATFNSGSAGTTPLGRLLIDGDTIYGTTSAGGTTGGGTIFKFSLATGTMQTLASFTYITGGNPASGVVLVDGQLYGTAAMRGSGNNGTVYRADPTTGVITPLLAFDLATNGGMPQAELVADGPFLYGTASAPAGNTAGTIFRIDPAAGQVTIVARFSGSSAGYPNGKTPSAAMLPVGSFLYGTTYSGGSRGYGVLFRLDPATGVVTSVLSFPTSNVRGFNPRGGLTPCGIQLCGTTSSGAIYRFDPATGVDALLATLDDAMPFVTGELASDGTSLFGVAAYGGPQQKGTLFQVDIATGLHGTFLTFNGSNGESPFGGLVVHDGYLYGTTRNGGAKGGGTLFRVPIDRPRRRAVGR